MRVQVDVEAAVGGPGKGFRLRAAFTTEGSRAVLFGPSGSGKTLTLRAVAGLLRPDRGRVVLDGRTLCDVEAGIFTPPRERGLGYVFQDYALFPHLTVRQNAAFGLTRFPRPLTKAGAARVAEVLELFGLADLAEARPGDLSGGQRQRAALARAVAGRPRALLLDEPFSALDLPLRLRLRQEVKALLDRLDIPLILVSHDPAEALAFGGEIVLYRDGEVRGALDPATLPAKDAEARLLEAAFG